MEGETKLKKDRTRAKRKMKRSRVRYEEKETIKKGLKRNKMTQNPDKYYKHPTLTLNLRECSQSSSTDLEDGPWVLCRGGIYVIHIAAPTAICPGR